MSITSRYSELREQGKVTAWTILIPIIEFVFIIICIVALNNIYKNEPTVTPNAKIKNYDELGLEIDQSVIATKIYKAISLNTTEKVEDGDIEVKSNTIINQKFANGAVDYNYFVVSIPKVNLDFQVVYYTSKDENFRVTDNPTTVMCLPKSQLGTKDCKDEYDNKGTYQVLSIFEQFMGGYNNPKHSYRYSVEQSMNKQTYLKITSISCDKDNSKSQTLVKVSDYIDSLGFSLNDLKYEIVGICER